MFIRGLRAMLVVTLSIAAALVPYPSDAAEAPPDTCIGRTPFPAPWSSHCATSRYTSAAITPTGNLVGTVTDSTSGAPIEGISVFLTDAETLEWWRDSDVLTAADGSYAVRVPTGDYYVLFADQFGGHEAAFWDGATRWDESMPATVDTNETTQIDREMKPGGSSISGTVVSLSGVPLEGIIVYAVHEHTQFDDYAIAKASLGLGITDVDGAFTVEGLPAGEYWLFAARVVPEAWHGSVEYTGDPVADGATIVALDGTASDANITVDTSGAVVGFAWDAFTGERLSGICGEAISPTDLTTVLASDVTNQHGRFHLKGLTDAPFYLRYTDCTRGQYVTAWAGADAFVDPEGAIETVLAEGEYLVVFPGLPLLFADIYYSFFRDDIIWLGLEGITSGCDPDLALYCPTDSVTRGQMAALLVRSFDLTAIEPSIDFDDDDASIFETDIAKLATAGITTGCGGNDFCPLDPVTRGQMAAFLVRALGLTDIDPTIDFDDDDASIFETDIAKLATAGITSGCGGNNFCPSDSVTRGQMAAFLKRALTN